jgi:hypothetical protein
MPCNKTSPLCNSTKAEQIKYLSSSATDIPVFAMIYNSQQYNSQDLYSYSPKVDEARIFYALWDVSEPNMFPISIKLNEIRDQKQIANALNMKETSNYFNLDIGTNERSYKKDWPSNY